MAPLHRPAFHPRWRVTLVRGEGLFFTAERDAFLFESDPFQSVAPLIDGKRTTEAIVDALGAGDVNTMAQLFYAMSVLQRLGCVREAMRAPTGVGDHEAEGVLGRVVGRGVRLVLTPDYLHPGLSDMNEVALRTRQPWCPAKITGKEIWIGPVFVPGETACWRCLAHRLRVTRPIDAFISARARGAVDLAQPGRATRRDLARMARALQREGRNGMQGVITFDVESHSVRRHPVHRRPQCPACGDAGLYGNRVQTPVRQGVPLPRGSLDMTALVNHVSGLTAAINPTRTGAPAGLYVYDAAPSWPTPVTNTKVLRMALSFRSVGAANTRARARHTALSEVVERYSGSTLGDEPAVRISLNRLGARALHPNRVMLFSDAQYRAARSWNAKRDAACGVPQPFDPDAVIDWTPLWSLSSGEQRYLPTAMLYHGSRRPGRSMCSSDTNGNAAGDSLDDAIVRGFLELAERDAIAIWWYNRIPRPRIDLDSFGATHCRRLRQALWQAGREMWVLDLTTDLGVPTYAAISRRVAQREEILMGFGARFEPEAAALHAINEMARQVGLVSAVQTRRSDPAPLFAQWMRAASLESQPFLGGSGATADTRFRRPEQDSLAVCADIARRANVEILVLDQTRPDLRIPVVRVVAPGLRPAFARLAPGRLYDVPIQLRWCRAPLPEESLNDFPFFL